MTLRILHTADWHLGQTLQGFPRDNEHAAALDQLVEIARDHAVDALILAGDVFDRETPPPRAETLFYTTMMRLRADNPRLTIVITAGNHDSAGRIEAPRPLYDSLAIHAAGHVARRDGVVDMARHLVALPDAGGVVRAHVLALPYPRPSDLPGYGAASEEPGSPVVREVRKLYAEAVALARAIVGDAPLIATGHLNVKGGEASEGAERAILVGGEHEVPDDIFDASLAYVALGHLHKPQSAGRPNVRYCGSLFPLSATEMPYRHGVTLLSVEDGQATFQHIPIARPVPFLRVPAKGALPPGEVAQALAALALDPAMPRENRPFVQLALKLDGPAPGLKAELDRIAETFPVRLVGHVVLRPGLAEGETEAPENAPGLAARDPADLFRAAFAETHSAAPDHRHLHIFHSARNES